MRMTEQLLTRAVRFGRMSGDMPVFAPDMVEAVRERYRFWEYPTKISECDLDSDGAVFTTGISNGNHIDGIRVLRSGIMVQGLLSTDLLDDVIDDLLAMTQDRFSLTFTETDPVSRAYMSAVAVEMTGAFPDKLGALRDVQNAMASGLRANGFTTNGYEFNSLTLLSDPQSTAPIQPGRFLIERRADQPFSANIFYSEAPLSTKAHLEALEVLDSFL